MAQYRSIQLSFWTDAKVIDDFTPEDRYFYLYIMTNPHTNLSGCYEISLKQMSDETGYSKETIQKLLDRMQNTHKVIIYSQLTKELLIIHWSKYNWTNSDKFRTAVEREIASVKDQGFKEFLTQIYDGSDTVSIPYRYPMDTTVTVTNTITDTVIVPNRKKSERFTPPTLSEVQAYCFERNNGIDAESFIDFYSSKGWKVGNQPMKDWKACVRTWEKRNGKKSSKEEAGDYYTRVARGEA